MGDDANSQGICRGTAPTPCSNWRDAAAGRAVRCVARGASGGRPRAMRPQPGRWIASGGARWSWPAFRRCGLEDALQCTDRTEVSLFIERGHIVAGRDAWEIEHPSGKVLVEEAGTTGVLSGGLRGYPGLQFGGRGGIEQPCEALQVNALMFEGEGQVTRQGRRGASCRRIPFVDLTVLAQGRARFANGTVRAKRLDCVDAVVPGKPAITYPVRH